jgi:hypothetical protein
MSLSFPVTNHSGVVQRPNSGGRIWLQGNFSSRLNPRPANMLYQLSWKILPGLRGLSCSDFSASPTARPDNDQGVAFECATEAARDAFLRELESHFAPQRFSNGASAFESVKSYVLEKMANR